MVEVESRSLLRSEREIQFEIWSRFYEHQYPQLTDADRLVLVNTVVDIAMRSYTSQEDFDEAVNTAEKEFLEINWAI